MPRRSDPASASPFPCRHAHENHALLALSSALLSTAVAAAAAPASSSGVNLSPRSGLDAYLEGEYLLGDWGGGRERLKQSGVDLFAYWTGIMSGNVAGGKNQGGFAYVDDWWVGVRLDLEKLAGWQGATFVVSGINRDGGVDLTNEYIGSVYSAQQTFGGQRTFLYQVFLDQLLFDDRVSIKLGRFSASDDFNGSPLYGLYVNNGINGNIRNVLFNTQFSAYPFATWAARLKIDPTPETYLKLGVFQTSDRVFENDDHGLDWSIRGGDGVFLIAQLGWEPELFQRPVAQAVERDGKTVMETEMKGLPGHYWVGATFSSWEGYREFGTGELRDDSYGFYVHADQMVYQEEPGSTKGLTVWAASGYYPQEEISIVPFQVNSGLVYSGLFPLRDEDKTMVGVIYGRFSRDYADTIEATGAEDPRYELVLEAGHRFQLTRFAYIQPDIQYIIRPGGTGRIPDAVVIGAQMGVTF